MKARSSLTCILLASSALFLSQPAASTIYSLNVSGNNGNPSGPTYTVLGFIGTDDTIGPLSAINITQWSVTQTQGFGNLTDTFSSLHNNAVETNTFVLHSTINPISSGLTATSDGLLIGGITFHSTTIYGHDTLLSLTASATNIHVFGVLFGWPYTIDAQSTIAAPQSVAAVPGPIVGSGLPGLLLGLLVWWRRRKP